MIHLLLVDDHWMVLDGLKRLLQAEDDMTVVATARRADEGIMRLKEGLADILVADLRLPDCAGLDFIRQARAERPDLRTILLTASISAEQLATAQRLGVRGVVLKEEPFAVLTQCIRAVGRGGSFNAGRLGGRGVASEHVDGNEDPVRPLTAREAEIARLAAAGLRTREIGDELGIAAGTVKIHLHSIYDKLGIGTRVELANAIRRAAAD